MPKRITKTVGIVMLRILAALTEGPLEGLHNGPRPALDYLDLEIPYLGERIKPRKRKAKPSTRKTMIRDSMDRVLRLNLARRERVAEPWKWRYLLTPKGLETFRLLTDDEYMMDRRMRQYDEVLRKRRVYLRWYKSANPELMGDPMLRWTRFWGVRFGWKALVERHPLEGWQFQLVRPDGIASAWAEAKVQEEGGCKREAEATMRHYAEQWNRTRRGNNDG